MIEATFKIRFNNYKNISVKIGGDSVDSETDWVDVNDLSQELSITVNVNDSFDGHRYLIFFGETSDFITTPSVTITDSNGATYTANAFSAYGYDPFKYYIGFGLNYNSSYDDDIPFIRGSDGYKYINPTLFIGDTACNCGGLSDVVNFYENDFGFIGIYNIDKNTITSIIQNNRYSLNEIGNYGEILDIFKYIKTVYKTHINIAEDNPTETIYINGVAVNGQGKPLNNYIIEFETDIVKIQGYYNNVLDNDSEISLNIPYYGLYHLDSFYINHNLKLKFICDLMTNNTLCSIYIDDVIIDVVELKTGYEIPLNELNINETKQRIYSTYNEDCFIVLKQKRIANNRINTIIENTTIETEINNNDLSGFIRCENVIFYENNLTDTEKTIIIDHLKNGVYI